jgi:hypothetical protein
MKIRIKALDQDPYGHAAYKEVDIDELATDWFNASYRTSNWPRKFSDFLKSKGILQ